jgi:hypothetical protein
LGYQPNPAGNLLGFGLRWGDPNSDTVGSGLDDQYSMETFYRVNVSQKFVIALLAATLCCESDSVAQEPSLRDQPTNTSLCSLTDAAPETRPGEKGKPTNVSVGVYFNDIVEVDDRSQTFAADINVAAAWRDTCILAPRPRGSVRVALRSITAWPVVFRLPP